MIHSHVPPVARTMEIRFDKYSNSIGVLVLVGRLDVMSAREVRERLIRTVDEGGTKLIVDLHQVTFIDSSGLGALIGGLKAARLAGGDLRIARLGENAGYILRVSALDRVLKPFTTVEAAMASYA